MNHLQRLVAPKLVYNRIILCLETVKENQTY